MSSPARPRRAWSRRCQWRWASSTRPRATVTRDGLGGARVQHVVREAYETKH